MIQRHTNEVLRELIKEGLSRCTHKQRIVFCRMYAGKEYQRAKPDDFLYNIDSLAKYHINEVVDKMEWHKLDHAMDQIDRTLKKNGEVQQTRI